MKTYIHFNHPFWCYRLPYVFRTTLVFCKGTSRNMLSYCPNGIKETAAPGSRSISIFSLYHRQQSDLCIFIFWSCWSVWEQNDFVIPAQYQHTFYLQALPVQWSFSVIHMSLAPLHLQPQHLLGISNLISKDKVLETFNICYPLLSRIVRWVVRWVHMSDSSSHVDLGTSVKPLVRCRSGAGAPAS